MFAADGYLETKGGQKSFALISVAQRDHYGSYVEALRALKVDLILSPSLLSEDERADLPFFHEVGHA